MDIQKDIISYDDFAVMDENDNPVIGLVDENFTRKLYNPDKNEVSGTISVIISEIGSGLYRVSFTPNKLGNWSLVIYNDTYFPWGKGSNYKCVEYQMSNTIELLKRVLGLSNENIRLFDPVYNSNHKLLSGTFKIYDTKSDCELDVNNIGIYKVIAEYNSNEELINFREVKE